MIKLLNVDTSGKVPCPNVENIDPSSLRAFKTLGGVRLGDSFPDLTLELTDGDECPSGPVDYFQAGLLNITSWKLRKVLEDVGAEVEYLPVRVLYNGKRTQIEYFVANPLERFNAIDIVNSDVELDEELGDALSVNRLVIDKLKFNGVKLAVIAEIQKIGVQAEVAVAVESSGCVGCVFIEPISFRY